MTISLADFWERLRHSRTNRWTLTDNRKPVRSVGGDLQTFSHGTRRWSGSVTVAPAANDEFGEFEALINDATEREFLAYQIVNAFPRADPDGSILGGSSPAVFGVPQDHHEIRIDGLPAGYVISPRDFLSVSYSSGSKVALLRVVTGGAASGTGLSPILRVSPARPANVAENDPVTLIKAAGRFIITPGSVEFGEHDAINTLGASFDMESLP